ncbi:hypothetical protein [Nocardioides litoris]|uniref:hypothetical protein n=1 Tax=Nocardioides litoris TaxID=1926648 RepID=UPI0011243011|nr:hypothetical protein [Nocardioides litoris]
MQAPDRPLTAEGVLAWARDRDATPAAVRPHPHPFEQDQRAGGFACVGETHLYVALHDGSSTTRSLVDVDAGTGVDGVLDEEWARSRHRQRALDPRSLGPWQSVAVAAVEAGTVPARLPAAVLADLGAAAFTEADRDHADWLWLRLHRSPHPPLRALAGDDRLLAPPPPPGRAGRRTHPCPLCATPAPHLDRYPRAVCDECARRTVDRHGAPVVGWNASLGGGFEARAPDAEGAPAGSGAVNDDVTRTGEVWVDGHPCRMGEARFGGIVVEAVGDVS